MILNLSDAPSDPIRRLLWLSGVKQAVQKELDEAYSVAYFEARQQGQFEAAASLGLHGRKTAIAFTRKRNNALGRIIRWGDGLDRLSTNWRGY